MICHPGSMHITNHYRPVLEIMCEPFAGEAMRESVHVKDVSENMNTIANTEQIDLFSLRIKVATSLHATLVVRRCVSRPMDQGASVLRELCATHA